jgi:hypothetical protein
VARGNERRQRNIDRQKRIKWRENENESEGSIRRLKISMSAESINRQREEITGERRRNGIWHESSEKRRRK